MKRIKRSVIVATALLLAHAVNAAELNVVEVPSIDVNCLFNVNCTNIVEESTSPILLPGGTGRGALITRIVTGEPGSDAEGLFGYLYQIDLRRITGTNDCFTNVVRCVTNRFDGVTNLVVCRTNSAISNLFTCVTNRLPATNFVCCLTNSLPGTNVVRCITRPDGQLVCFTNTFAATNVVLCITNGIPARQIVSCQTTQMLMTNIVRCFTNHVPTNIVCVTNRIPCPGSTPCISSLSINFGRIVPFEWRFSLHQVLVISNGVTSLAPAGATVSNGVVTIHFDPPVCAGERSFWVGLLSSNAPVDARVALRLSGGDTLVVSAPGPGRPVRPITCDFSALLEAVRNISLAEIDAPNANAQENRRQVLINHVREAMGAARAGDIEEVLEGIGGLISKVDGDKNDWVIPRVSQRLSPLLEDIVDCLSRFDRGMDDDVDHNPYD